jgi:hypothetical protein
MSLQERRAFPRAIAWHVDWEHHQKALKDTARKRDLFWVKLGGLVGAMTGLGELVARLLENWHP